MWTYPWAAFPLGRYRLSLSLGHSAFKSAILLQHGSSGGHGPSEWCVCSTVEHFCLPGHSIISLPPSVLFSSLVTFSGFLPLLPAQGFLPLLRYISTEAPPCWWAQLCPVMDLLWNHLEVSGTRQALVSSHRGHPAYQNFDLCAVHKAAVNHLEIVTWSHT